MAYYKKRHLIEALQPDVLILQKVAKKDISSAADPNLPWHLPFSVDGLNVVALWARQLNRELKYARVTHQIVDRHAGFLSGEGAESTKSYFHTRNQRFRHHIDYAFLSDGVPAQLEVGDSDDWLAHSDHMPLILDIE